MPRKFRPQDAVAMSAARRGWAAIPCPAMPISRKPALRRWPVTPLDEPCAFDQLAAHSRDDKLTRMNEIGIERIRLALFSHVPVTHRLSERCLTRGDTPVVGNCFPYLGPLSTEMHLASDFYDQRALIIRPKDPGCDELDGLEQDVCRLMFEISDTAGGD